MATRFTRVSVQVDDRQIDASLPSGRPVAELLAELASLLSLPVGQQPSAWALSSPRHGMLAADRSLDEGGVLDGDVLFLTAAAEAAESPVVDDVITAIAGDVDAGPPRWSGRYRDRAVSCLLGAVLVALIVALVLVPNADAGGGGLLGAFVAAVLAARVLRARLGVVLGWAGLVAVPLGLVRLLGDSALDVRWTAAAAATVVGAAAVGWAARYPAAVVIAGCAAGVGLGGTAAIMAAGVDASAIAAWASIGLVLALGVIPQLALTAGGIVGLAARAEAGTAVPRAAAARAADSGRQAVDGALAATALLGAAGAATLIWAGRPAQAGLGGLLALLFLLRSRAVSHAHQVGFLLAVPVTALIAAAAALPRWANAGQPTTWWVCGLVIVAVLVAGCGYLRLPDVTAARLSRLWDRLDALAVLALIPVVLYAQDIFSWLADKL